MDIPRILYEPYVIFLFVAFIISIIYFYIQKSRAQKQEQQDPNYDEESSQKNKYTNAIIAFLVSYLLLLIGYYGYKYFQAKQTSSSSGTVSSGGSASIKEKVSKAVKEQIKEKLTIVDDDIDIGVFEN
jgi:Na+/H+ antiporter NhaC